MRSNSFRYGLKVSFLIALLLTPGEVKALEPLTITYSSLNATYTPLWLGLEAGFYKKYGLDVSLVFISSTPVVTQSMLAGEIQVANITGPGVVLSSLSGGDLVMIAGAYGVITTSLVVRSNISNPQQLKGGKIGITRFGSLTDMAAQVALEHYGLDSRRVVILQMGGFSEAFAALEKGSIDGAILVPPLLSKAKMLGYRELLDMTTIDYPFQANTIAVRRPYLTENFSKLVNFMKGYVDGIRLFKADKEASIRAMAKYSKIVDRSILDETYKYFNRIIRVKPYPTLKGIANIYEFEKKKRPFIKAFDPRHVVDTTILRQLEVEGFL